MPSVDSLAVAVPVVAGPGLAAVDLVSAVELLHAVPSSFADADIAVVAAPSVAAAESCVAFAA